MRKFFREAKQKIEAEIASITGDDEPQQQQQQPPQHQQQYYPPQPPHQGFERAVFAHFMVRDIPKEASSTPHNEMQM